MRDAELLEKLTKWRRDLHQIPEAALCEEKTSRYILSELKPLKPDKLETMAGTGIRCVFYGKNRERSIAFRADMDALSVQEETGAPFKSQHESFMHACGHDGHMAMALATAQYAAALRDEGSLPVNAVILFQPAEESVGGALPMIESGALNDPDITYVFGCHMMPDKPLGKISLKSGAMMASTCELDIEFTGSSAHGAMPHSGNDAIAAFASFYSMAQTAISRLMSPTESALFSVGKVTAGDRRNIIAEKVVAEGIARAFSPESAQKLEEIIAECAEKAASVYGVKARFIPRMRYPATVNDDFCAREVMGLAGESFVPQEQLMIAEDFSHFLERVPGAYFYVGCGDEAHNHSLHSSRFNFDERALLTGALLQRKILRHFAEIADRDV
ncbi:MAG: M20 metallopeptidase family protein [Christensenellales bacterium]